MSQLGADAWVLSKFPTGGFFLDVGCADGTSISNTVLLEQNGWKGVCIDAFPRNFDNRPNSIVVQAVVSSEKDTDVHFVVSGEDPDLSGITNRLGKWSDRVMAHVAKEVRLKTKLLGDILDQHDAPSFIEYMNLDIEGSEYDVLSTFPFDVYTFGCISVEHNHEEPKRSMIRTILEKNGYVLEKNVSYDDWYVRVPTFTQDWFSARVPEIQTSLMNVTTPNPQVLEIGSFEGLSSTWFLEHFPSGRITCIDTWEGSIEHTSFDMRKIEATFRGNVLVPYASRVRILKGYSHDVMFGLEPRSFDVAYVDGSHDRADTLSDIVMAWNLLKIGGVMLVDDCGCEDPGPRTALQAFLAVYDGRHTVLHSGYQVHVLKLK